MSTYKVKKPLRYKGKYYKPGDMITGFTSWWRSQAYLRTGKVEKIG